MFSCFSLENSDTEEKKHSFIDVLVKILSRPGHVILSAVS